MVIIRLSAANGWHDARVEPRAAIPMEPASSVLHYAQAIFEGTKAYKAPDGEVILFRLNDNVSRFRRSAIRMAMPPLPESLFVDAVMQLVLIDRDRIPDGDASLYLRPVMFATEIALGPGPLANAYLSLSRAQPQIPKRMIRTQCAFGCPQNSVAQRQAVLDRRNAARTTPPA
jgi:branched-chain amino acid aminotransferase